LDRGKIATTARRRKGSAVTVILAAGRAEALGFQTVKVTRFARFPLRLPLDLFAPFMLEWRLV
jgi:hypothetical protein